MSTSPNKHAIPVDNSHANTKKSTVDPEESARERKKRKKAKRNHSATLGQGADGEGNVTVKSEDEAMNHKPVATSKSRPLTTLVVSHAASNQPTLLKPLSVETAALVKPNNASQAGKVDRSTKLEQKVEKQRAKLKEAEARAVADAEKLRTEAQRIGNLEGRIKELEAELTERMSEAQGVKETVDEHLKVSRGSS
jgi:hypothetical protein